MGAPADRFVAQLRRELRRGTLPIRLLEVLADGPSYGYAMIERLGTGRPAGESIGPSTLYPALARLRRAGLVRSFHGTVSHGPLRRYYELTERGRSLLPTLRAVELAARAPAARRHQSHATGSAT